MADHKKTVEPYIPADQDLPQITPKAVVLGALLSAILGAANAYLGLKVGLTVSASIPAAVISMAALRLFKNHNILENNIVQTAASAGESLAAGVIFTLPALILLGYWEDFPFGETFAIALSGGVLGVLFTIPLRRALIVESELLFPEGVATGEVLKAGSKGGGEIRQILYSGVGAGLYKLCVTGLKLFSGSMGFGITIGRSVIGLGTDLGVALLAVGYIVGLNIAVLVFVGGSISFIFAIPIWMSLASDEELNTLLDDDEGGLVEGYDASLTIWSVRIRYMGVGAMVVGGLWALISLVGPLIAGIKASVKALKALKSHSGDVLRTEVDTPIHFVLGGILVMFIPIFLVFVFVIDVEILGVSSATYWGSMVFALIFSIIAGFLFSSVAGYMAGLVGSSNNPISGVTIATVLFTSLLLYAIYTGEVEFTGDENENRAAAGASAAIIVGAVVACSAALAGDNLQDLKAGQIVGATPWKQQIMQVVGVASASLVIPPSISLLYNAYGLGTSFPREGMNPDEALSAPQASLMQTVAQGVFAQDLQWTLIGIGGGIAAVIIIIDIILQKMGSSFRAPVLAVAVGIYLPIELATPIFLGGLIAFGTAKVVASKASKAMEDVDESVESSQRRGLLFASGLITGEALVGIILSIPFAIAQSTDVIRVLPKDQIVVANVLGGLVFLAFAGWLAWTALQYKSGTNLSTGKS